MIVGSAFHTLLGIAVVAIIAIAWPTMPRISARREAQRFEKAEREVKRQEEEARQQAQKRQEEEEAKRIREEALAQAAQLKASCDAQMEQDLQRFKDAHDQLVDLVRQYAKQGCDAEFQQRFGVTRPPKAPKLEDDPEVQEYLRAHYPELRDAAVNDCIAQAIEAEANRQLEQEDAEAADAAGAAGENATQGENADETATGTNTEPGSEGENGADGEGEVVVRTATETKAADAEARLEALRNRVRENYDADSLRSYLLAAIGSRFNQQGLPVGTVPWQAYTQPSPLGYGELVPNPGAPVPAQNAYRDFAWRKFHLGRRAEKPTRGEYSWPASHELGDADAGTGVETPAGYFGVSTAEGPLPLRELSPCRWAHGLLPHGDLLLGADERRFLLVNLEGLHKGKRLFARFGAPDAFLEETDGTDQQRCAVGSANRYVVGISVSKPEAASPGDAPYRIVECTGTGFTLELTHDARRHDADTYPQFMQLCIAWRSEQAPLPRETILHAIQ